MYPALGNTPHWQSRTFNLPDLFGRPVSLASFRGSKTLLLFWNPGCGFCLFAVCLQTKRSSLLKGPWKRLSQDTAFSTTTEKAEETRLMCYESY